MINRQKLIDHFRRAQAKALRAAETSAERRLWQALRGLPVHGSHFRRQVPIGPYVADFACLAARLVVEVDGASHTTDAGIAHDARRTAFLASEGFRILRFWNAEIFDNERGVVETIHAALHGAGDTAPRPIHPTPAPCADPPPQGEGSTLTPDPSPVRERVEF